MVQGCLLFTLLLKKSMDIGKKRPFLAFFCYCAGAAGGAAYIE